MGTVGIGVSIQCAGTYFDDWLGMQSNLIF